MMSKYIVFLLICFSFFSSQTSYATSGRTNSSGCHNSKKVGYHCHGAPKSKYKSTSKTYTPSSKKSTAYVTPATKASKFSIELIQGIQIQLNSLGYKVGKADGILGEQTKSAIKRFQKDTNITVDGTPSSNLLVKLVLANS